MGGISGLRAFMGVDEKKLAQGIVDGVWEKLALVWGQLKDFDLRVRGTVRGLPLDLIVGLEPKQKGISE